MNYWSERHPVVRAWVLYGGFIILALFVAALVTLGWSSIVKDIEKPLPAVVVSPTTIDNHPTQHHEMVFTPDFSLPVASGGLAPVITRVETKQPVVFLGIDDGAYKDPSVVKALADNHIKASLYLAKTFIASNPDFFKDIIAQGSLVENHTLNHDTRMVWTQGYAQQKAEICGMADYEEQVFGRRPVFFRPPGGNYSDVMRKAAYDCGMKAVVTWIAKANGGSMQYQIGNSLRPGDVVLMHFRPEFLKDLQAFVDAQNAAGLHTELLEDALPKP